MGWAVGYFNGRDIGYGVPANCDRPGCDEQIDRGLGYVCGGEPYGGDHGCGLFFCEKHLVSGAWYVETGEPVDWEEFDYENLSEDDDVSWAFVCEQCADNKQPFEPTPDVQEWIDWKLNDESWAQWRSENPQWVTENTK